MLRWTRFAECHVQFPVCGASRCSLLTGLPTADTGHRSLYYFLRRDEPNMLRYLKDGRYGTFWFGKNGALAPESSPLSPTEWRDTSVKLGRSGFPGGEPPWLTDEPLTMRFDAKFDRRSSPDYDLVQMAIKVLERKKKDRSFCIFFLLVQPHPP